MPGFAGGYVGVDVFFVISGYLITGVLLRDGEPAGTRLVRFYERRARRIVPALAVVLFACVVPAWMWMTPPQLKAFGGSLAAVGVFSSNLWFWRTTGYFAPAANEQPLLHTWSLGVEEQFYLLYPPLIWLLARRTKREQMGIVVGLALASLALSGALARNAPVANFYLLPTRAWELLLGALLVMAGPVRARVRPVVAGWLAVLGLAAIAAATFGFTAKTPVPGPWGLVPTAGAALVIGFAGSDTPTGRVLASPVFVRVGLMSYSLYLWHYVWLSFARVYSLDPPSTLMIAACLAATGACGYLSWRLVERPFRIRGYIAPGTMWATTAVAASLIVAIGATTYARVDESRNAVIQRYFPAVVAAKSEGLQDAQGRRCSDRLPADACRFGLAAREQWVLVGDSEARMLAVPLWEQLRGRGAGLIDLTASACAYAPGISFDDPLAEVRCDAAYNNARRQLLLSLPASTVVVHSALASLDDAPAAESVEHAVEELLAHGHRVVLVYPVPEAAWPVPERIAKLIVRGASREDVVARTAFAHEDARRQLRRADHALDRIPASPRLVRVYPEQLFCGTRRPGWCVTTTPTDVLYADQKHLSPAGAAQVVSTLLEAAGTR